MAGHEVHEKIRVLIGSPVRQDSETLYEFLESLKEVQKENIKVDYFFIDDNNNKVSSNLLYNFLKISEERVLIEQGQKIDAYIRTEDTHYWKESLIWKIAEYKNRIIDYSRSEGYDYLFLVDSDLVLNPKTLISLISTNKDIVSEVFWTKWQRTSVELPQVWLYDEYSLVPINRGEVINKTESDNSYISFIEQLRRPGIYEVGGLGACTLISKNAIAKGVNFNEIYNLSFWGEDRHFCIRAAALGFKLYVETAYPAYHIYRKEYLNGVGEFKKRCQKDLNAIYKITSTDEFKVGAYGFTRVKKSKDNKLTLAILVRNESEKFIKEVLIHASQYIDNAVILDDASEDNTVEICKEILKDIPLTIVSNKEHGFSNEAILRKQLWQMTIDTNPDWIVFLDADEIFEDKITDTIEALLNQSDFDHYDFRLYDMWNETHYREDEYWQAHNYYRPFLIRYQPNFDYYWHESALHCGRLPQNIFNLKGCVCYIKLKHLGWSTQKLREDKYIRYLSLDPKVEYGIMEQYRSILDENPKLIKWE